MYYEMMVTLMVSTATDGTAAATATVTIMLYPNIAVSSYHIRDVKQSLKYCFNPVENKSENT